MHEPAADLLTLARAIARRWRWRLRHWDVDDLAHEAYVAMAEAACASPQELYRAGWNRLRRLFRKDLRERCVPLPRQVAAPDAHASEDVLDLMRRVLPRRELSVLVALMWEGRSFADVAVDLGVTSQRVWQIRQQALGRLRGYLGGDDGSALRRHAGRDDCGDARAHRRSDEPGG